MRTKLTFTAIVMVMLSCSPSETKDTIAVPDKDNDKVVLAQKMFDAFNQHRWDVMANYYSDSALFLDPAFGKTYLKQSRSQTVDKYARFQSVFPDIKDEIVAMYPSDDKVIVEFVSRGTLISGVKLELPIVTVLTYKDSLIVKDATYYDVECFPEEENPGEIEIP
ncbi:MAG TPA: nuclear transport factor 2 family protein [Chryseolinea sp.]|nr:nuclear transport factor 2 family protein [Chryseolinea sp.]